MLPQIVDSFPYPLLVFTSKGIIVLANPAFLKETGMSQSDIVKNKYNIFYNNCDNFQLNNAANQVFFGKTFLIEYLKNPLSIFLKTIPKHKDVSSKAFDKAIVFPVYDDHGMITNGVMAFID